MATVTVRELAQEWHAPEDVILGAINEIDEFHRDQDRRDLEYGFGDGKPRPSWIANQNEIDAWREEQRGGDAVGPEPEPQVDVSNVKRLEEYVEEYVRGVPGPPDPPGLADKDL